LIRRDLCAFEHENLQILVKVFLLWHSRNCPMNVAMSI
jgi:hypothetical protein